MVIITEMVLITAETTKSNAIVVATTMKCAELCTANLVASLALKRLPVKV